MGRYIDRLALFMFQKDDLLKEVVKRIIFTIDIHTSFEENYLNKINGQNFSDLLMKIDRRLVG